MRWADSAAGSIQAALYRDGMDSSERPLSNNWLVDAAPSLQAQSLFATRFRIV
jgi:hypothetical protein